MEQYRLKAWQRRRRSYQAGFRTDWGDLLTRERRLTMKSCQPPACVARIFPTGVCLHCSATCLPTSPCGGAVNPSWPLRWSACPTCICTNWGTCGRSSSTCPWGPSAPCRSDSGSRWARHRTTTSDNNLQRAAKKQKRKQSLRSGAAPWPFSSVFWPNAMEPQSSAWTWRNFSPYRIIFGSFSLPSIICKSANFAFTFFFPSVVQSLMFFQLCSQLLLGVCFQIIL